MIDERVKVYRIWGRVGDVIERRVADLMYLGVATSETDVLELPHIDVCRVRYGQRNCPLSSSQHATSFLSHEA